MLNIRALTTLEALKKAIGLDVLDVSQDENLTNIINTSSNLIAKYCNTEFYKRTLLEEYEYPQTGKITLSTKYIRSITEVVSEGNTLLPEQYKVNSSGILKLKDIPWTSDDIAVTFDAGYVLPKDEVLPDNPRDLPEELERACLMMCVNMYKQGVNGSMSSAPAGLVKSEKIFDYTYTYATGAELQALLVTQNGVSVFLDIANILDGFVENI